MARTDLFLLISSRITNCKSKMILKLLRSQRTGKLLRRKEVLKHTLCKSVQPSFYSLQET